MTKNESVFTSQMSQLIVDEDNTAEHSKQRVCEAAGAKKK